MLQHSSGCCNPQVDWARTVEVAGVAKSGVAGSETGVRAEAASRCCRSGKLEDPLAHSYGVKVVRTLRGSLLESLLYATVTPIIASSVPSGTEAKREARDGEVEATATEAVDKCREKGKVRWEVADRRRNILSEVVGYIGRCTCANG